MTINQALLKLSSFVFLLTVATFINAQNLLVNGGFEDINVCCEKKALCSPEGWFGINLHKYDHDIIPLNPEYKNKATGIAAIWIETGSPRFRIAWAKFAAITPLVAPLKANHTYIIKLKVLAHVYAISEFHISFSDSALPNLRTQKPAITLKNRRFIKGKNWVEITRQYTATGNEKYMAIGLLKPCHKIRYKSIKGNKGLGGIYIDDISLMATDSTEQEEIILATDSAKQYIYSENRRHNFARLCRGSNILFPSILKDPMVDSTTTLRNILSEERLVAFNVDINRPSYLTNVTYNNKYQIMPNAYHIINPILTYLKTNKQTEILLIGHVDIRTSDFENHSISVLQALGVREYLVKNGIAKTRIRVEGKGSYENIGNIAHPKGYNLNNRIEYIFTPQPTN